MNATVFKKIKENLKANHTYHHGALERGYVGLKEYKVVVYKGKFGEGYKLIYPTQKSNCSNIYHRIEYYIYNNKLPW